MRWFCSSLQFLYPFRLCDGSTKAGNQMNVIFDAAYQDGRTLKCFRGAPPKRGNPGL
jgi:hypothetical protein